MKQPLIISDTDMIETGNRYGINTDPSDINHYKYIQVILWLEEQANINPQNSQDSTVRKDISET